ncbi:hypothetical protein LTR64_000076 [Lithohypha guttulata]|uniref:uncharacterized protein n=1 Tax=Lithohypha guttulata TaxID=1690604 RepID=UPI002DDDE56A|nr:hypothetical protein LTR51_007438 [Lithohypha guttulata]
MHGTACLCKDIQLKVIDSGQSRSLLPVAHSEVENPPLVSSTTSASWRLSPPTRDVLSSPLSSLSMPVLDQILFDATKEFNIDRRKPVEGAGEKGKPQLTLIDREAAFLLRTYQQGIGVWMDVFDSSLSYQHGLLTLVASSPLLLYSTCALAARQLSLISCAQTWTSVAEKYYGNSLSLLRLELADPAMNPQQTMVASILLSSYELLKSPNHDNYHQHFRGAKSLVEALRAYNSKNRLMMASFWIYARHEVGEAMNQERPVMLKPALWPRPDDSNTRISDADVLCNDVLRVCCEVIDFIFGSSDNGRGRKWVKEWLGLHSDLEGWLDRVPCALNGIEYGHHESRRFWFARPAFASAMCFYHVSKLFLALHAPPSTKAALKHPRNFSEQIQNHAQQIIDIALSDSPESVLVTLVQPMFHAAKHIHDLKRREEAVQRLEQIRIQTGFHTESKVQLLKSFHRTSS